LSSRRYHSARGTKCDLDENEQGQVAHEILETGAAFFDTAWNQPMQAIKVLARKFPEVVTFQLNYCELGGYSQAISSCSNFRLNPSSVHSV
jgi:hypothetical protein